MRALTTDPSTRAHTIPPWYFWDGLFSDAELNEIEAIGDAACLEEGKVVTASGVGVVDQERRVCEIAFLAPDPKNAWLFERLLQLVASVNEAHYEFDLNGFSRVQYTVYRKVGANFGWHVDLHSTLQAVIQSEHEPRKLSVVLALTDPASYEGGQLQFNYGTPTSVEMPRGRIVLFPSFMLHQVTPILRGQRKTLVAWVLGPKFK